MKYEYCCKCDCATGKAGAGDDSLYTETDGPFCENCFPEFKSKQEQGEPVAMRYEFDGYGYQYIDFGSGSDWQTREKGAEPLYTAPQPKQEQDEPVAYINVEKRKLEWAKYTSWETPTVVNLPKIPLYTAPQTKGCDECGVGGGYALYCLACAEKYVKPEWVGLNGADWNDFNPLLVNDPHRIAEWVEKILKDKNT